MQYSADLLLDPELDDVHVYDLPDGDTARLVQFTTPIPSGWSADDLAYGSPVRVSGQVGPVQCHASTYTRNKLGAYRRRVADGYGVEFGARCDASTERTRAD
jgi:hypothetical protein